MFSDEINSSRRSAWGFGTAEQESWRDDALCAQVGGDIFYVDKGESTAPAKAVCSMCPVRVECLEWAIDHDDRWGIYGGLSPRERARIRRKRAA
nr:WhiB family transcriptional regulator [Mycobacterium malmoense]